MRGLKEQSNEGGRGERGLFFEHHCRSTVKASKHCGLKETCRLNTRKGYREL